ncbi:MAG TPA: DinB family protein [Phycisphaerae bacterium]|nr:DinB family protein [Phycisphaerae bacterium]
MLKDTFSFLLERHQNKMLPTLLADIPDEKLSSQPVAGINHPAWILGHLLAVEQKFAGGILRRPFQTSLDANWWETYGIGSSPKPDRGLYKSKEFYMTGLTETSSQLLTFIREKSDADLDTPNTDPDFGNFFPVSPPHWEPQQRIARITAANWRPGEKSWACPTLACE